MVSGAHLVIANAAKVVNAETRKSIETGKSTEIGTVKRLEGGVTTSLLLIIGIVIGALLGHFMPATGQWLGSVRNSVSIL